MRPLTTAGSAFTTVSRAAAAWSASPTSSSVITTRPEPKTSVETHSWSGRASLMVWRKPARNIRKPIMMSGSASVARVRMNVLALVTNALVAAVSSIRGSGPARY